MCFGRQASFTCIARYRIIAAGAPLTCLVGVTAEDLSDCMPVSLQINILCKREKGF